MPPRGSSNQWQSDPHSSRIFCPLTVFFLEACSLLFPTGIISLKTLELYLSNSPVLCPPNFPDHQISFPNTPPRTPAQESLLCMDLALPSGIFVPLYHPLLSNTHLLYDTGFTQDPTFLHVLFPFVKSHQQNWFSFRMSKVHVWYLRGRGFLLFATDSEFKLDVSLKPLFPKNPLLNYTQPDDGRPTGRDWWEPPTWSRPHPFTEPAESGLEEGGVGGSEIPTAENPPAAGTIPRALISGIPISCVYRTQKKN